MPSTPAKLKAGSSPQRNTKGIQTWSIGQVFGIGQAKETRKLDPYAGIRGAWRKAVGAQAGAEDSTQVQTAVEVNKAGEEHEEPSDSGSKRARCNNTIVSVLSPGKERC